MFSFRISRDTELRLLEERYAEELFVLVDQNRDHLREWLPWVDSSKSLTDTQQFIRTAVKRFASNSSFATGIWHQGELVGVIDLHQIDCSNRTTSIGYWLSASFQGKGLVTEACRALLNHAFSELKLNRVEIRCVTENKKSRAIPERLGFTQEGTVREALWLYNHFADLVIYGILASEWQDGTNNQHKRPSFS